MLNKNTEHGKAIDFLQRAVSTDDTRYFMCGLHFDVENLAIVSTDGRRLHRVIVRKREIFDSIVDLLNVDLSKSNIWEIKKAGSDFVATEPIEGQYPNYLRVIPEDNEMIRTDLVEKDCSISFEKPTAKNYLKSFEYFRLVQGLCQAGYLLNLTFVSDLHSVEWDYIYTSFADKYLNKAVKITGTTKNMCIKYTAVIMPSDGDKITINVKDRVLNR